eukprot:scaffold47_cov112-Isochrysis_galbana.AAC.10
MSAPFQKPGMPREPSMPPGGSSSRPLNSSGLHAATSSSVGSDVPATMACRRSNSTLALALSSSSSNRCFLSMSFSSAE